MSEDSALAAYEALRVANEDQDALVQKLREDRHRASTEILFHMCVMEIAEMRMGHCQRVKTSLTQLAKPVSLAEVFSGVHLLRMGDHVNGHRRYEVHRSDVDMYVHGNYESETIRALADRLNADPITDGLPPIAVNDRTKSSRDYALCFSA